MLSLHSGEFVDEETLVLMREKGIIFSPTVAWLHARCLPGYVLAENPAAFRKLRRVGAKSGSPFSASHDTGPGESRSTTLIQ